VAEDLLDHWLRKDGGDALELAAAVQTVREVELQRFRSVTA